MSFRGVENKCFLADFLQFPRLNPTKNGTESQSKGIFLSDFHKKKKKLFFLNCIKLTKFMQKWIWNNFKQCNIQNKRQYTNLFLVFSALV